MFQKTLGEVAMHAHQKRSSDDPRKDPQPGDITAYSSDDMTSIYRVTKREGRVVYYTQTTNGKTDEHDTFVEDWVAGSETDEVLHVAAADAREATQPTAAEVIADAEKALRKLTNEIGNIEVLGEYEALNINTGFRKNMRARIDGVEVECREALALCARWKKANGDPA